MPLKPLSSTFLPPQLVEMLVSCVYVCKSLVIVNVGSNPRVVYEKSRASKTEPASKMQLTFNQMVIARVR